MIRNYLASFIATGTFGACSQIVFRTESSSRWSVRRSTCMRFFTQRNTTAGGQSDCKRVTARIDRKPLVYAKPAHLNAASNRNPLAVKSCSDPILVLGIERRSHSIFVG